jgi:hypothetical protein
MPPPPTIADLLEQRRAAESAYNQALRDPGNDATIEDANVEQIQRTLYNLQVQWINAANAYRDALASDNNATQQEKQSSRDYVNNIDLLPKPENMDGGRRRRSSSARKSSAKKRASRRKPRSTKKRASRRYRHRRA